MITSEKIRNWTFIHKWYRLFVNCFATSRVTWKLYWRTSFSAISWKWLTSFELILNNPAVSAENDDDQKEKKLGTACLWHCYWPTSPAWAVGNRSRALANGSFHSRTRVIEKVSLPNDTFALFSHFLSTFTCRKWGNLPQINKFCFGVIFFQNAGNFLSNEIWLDIYHWYVSIAVMFFLYHSKSCGYVTAMYTCIREYEYFNEF